MAIRRGTTPTLTIIVEGVNLTGKTVYVTIGQASCGKLTKVSPNDDGSVWIDQEGQNASILLFLSQHETMGFHPGRAELQVRWVEEDGTAHASNIKPITLKKTLLEGVINYVE